MSRWLGIVLALAVAGGPASAQVFKPKASSSKKSSDDGSKKTTTAKKSTAKKASHTTSSKKKVASKSKKNQAAERSRPDDLTPDEAPKESDKDFVKITDDEDVE